MPAIDLLLFGDTSRDICAATIWLVAIVVVAMINAYNAILQSLEPQYAGISVARPWPGILLEAVINQPLVVKFGGTAGASGATILSLGLILCLIYYAVPETIKGASAIRLFVPKLIIVTGIMAAAVYAAVGWIPLSSRMVAAGVTVVGVLLGVIIFLAAGTWLKMLTLREMLDLPGGKLYMKFLQRIKRGN